MTEQIKFLAQLCSECLSADPAARQKAQQQLDSTRDNEQSYLELCRALIAISVDEQVPHPVRLSAATYAKNAVVRGYEEHSSAHADSMEAQRQSLRDTLANGLLWGSKLDIRQLLGTIFQTVSKVDYPEKWPNLVDALVGGLSSSPEMADNHLHVITLVTRNFRYFLNPTVAQEDAPESLEAIVAKAFPALLQTLTSICGLGKSFATDDVAALRALEILKVFHNVTFSYMPKSLVATAPQWLNLVLDIVREWRSLQAPEESFASSPEANTPKQRLLKRGLKIMLNHQARHSALMATGLAHVYSAVKDLVVDASPRLQSRVISQALDCIARSTETSAGWKCLNADVRTLIENAIMRRLFLTPADKEMWEEDEEEYIRLNLVSEEDANGFRDNFTPRSSAINLLSVLASCRHAYAGGAKPKKGQRGKKGPKGGAGPSEDQKKAKHIQNILNYVTNGKNLDALSEEQVFGVLLGFGALGDAMSGDDKYAVDFLEKAVLACCSNASPFIAANALWSLARTAKLVSPRLLKDAFTHCMAGFNREDSDDLTMRPLRSVSCDSMISLVQRFSGEDHLNPFVGELTKAVLDSTKKNGEDDGYEKSMALITAICEAVGEEMEPFAEPAIAQIVEFTRGSLDTSQASMESEASMEITPSLLECVGALSALVSILDESEKKDAARNARVCEHILPVLASILGTSVPVSEKAVPDHLPEAALLLNFVLDQCPDGAAAPPVKVWEVMQGFAGSLPYRNFEELEDCITPIGTLLQKFGKCNAMYMGGNKENMTAESYDDGSLIAKFYAVPIAMAEESAKKATVGRQVFYLLLKYTDTSRVAHVGRAMWTAFFEAVQVENASVTYGCLSLIMAGFPSVLTTADIVSTRDFADLLRDYLLVAANIEDSIEQKLVALRGLTAVLEHLNFSQLNAHDKETLHKDTANVAADLAIELHELNTSDKEEEMDDGDDGEEMEEEDADINEDEDDDSAESETQEEFLERYAAVARDLDGDKDSEDEEEEDVELIAEDDDHLGDVPFVSAAVALQTFAALVNKWKSSNTTSSLKLINTDTATKLRPVVSSE